MFHLGCAVWAYKGWIGDLFPSGSAQKDLLRLYAERLTTVEGNTTFYATPDAATVQRWTEETPASFQFCFKLPRDVSHDGPVGLQINRTRTFVERLTPLGPRLGPMFLQLPPGYQARQLPDLERWLTGWQSIPNAPRVAVEVRHLSWWEPANEAALGDLLGRYNAGRVLMDVRPLDLGPLPGADVDLDRARDRKPHVPLHPLIHSQLALVRYIGHPDVDRNAELLDAWADRVAAWLNSGAAVYFFMHCPVEERAPTLCRMLQDRLAARNAVPPLPWDNAPTTATNYVNQTLPGFES